MKWPRVRTATSTEPPCAWLIQRFIDPDAEFVFVDDPDDVPDDATPFDIRGAELSHHNGNYSFETFLERYDVYDTALHELARIVHEADLATDPERNGTAV